MKEGTDGGGECYLPAHFWCGQFSSIASFVIPFSIKSDTVCQSQRALVSLFVVVIVSLTFPPLNEIAFPNFSGVLETSRPLRHKGPFSQSWRGCDPHFRREERGSCLVFSAIAFPLLPTSDEEEEKINYKIHSFLRSNFAEWTSCVSPMDSSGWSNMSSEDPLQNTSCTRNKTSTVFFLV